jgi:hypothetical protein
MKVCITCQKDVEGKKAVPIKEDRIIRGIRAMKKALGIAQMNELYVCEDDIKAHQERRRAFERSMLLAAMLAGIIVLLIFVTLVFSGRFEAWAFLAGILLALVVLAFPIFRYAPALEGMPVKPFGKQPAAATPAAQAKPAPAKADVEKIEQKPGAKPRRRKSEVS